ncbi:MAG TPA: hypothetical protein VMW61_02485 [Dehalococcoidales bacterium]|nr:hypothetical protein [Dehalococcoidales bacterium]
MKCPDCGKKIEKVNAKPIKFEKFEILVLLCPLCEAVLGAVNKPKK